MSECNRKTCKLSGELIPELGDGEPSPPKVGGVYTGLRDGCTSDPSGLHECGVEENHKLCVCANCGANWPNPEWHGAAQEVSPLCPDKTECTQRIADFLGRPNDSALKTFIYGTLCELGDTRELKAALRWIPVEEKLPDTSDSYLVWVRGIGDDGEMFQESVEAVFSCDRNHWTVQHGWLSHEVQGWMPMPKPPELG